MTGRTMRGLKGAAAAALVALATATPGLGQSLADALVGAYRTSGLLEQNRALLRAADEDVAQAVAALRPVLNYVARARYASPSLGDDFTGSVGLEAEMLLYDFGRSRLGIDGQKEVVLATREALRSVEQQVLLRATAAFMEVRRQNAFVTVRENNVRLLDEQLRAARDRFEVGEVTRTDVSIAEARQAAARSGLAAAQGALAQAREEYNAVVGSYPGRLAPPPTPQPAKSLAAARGVAQDRHPDLARARRDVTVAELGIAIAQAALRPALTGSAAVGLDDGGDDTSSLGLRLSGPIYQGGRIASQIRQAQASRDSARGALITAARNVDQAVGNAWATMMVARASTVASAEQVRAARLALRGGQEELQVGARTTLEVLDLEQELLDAQTNLISAEIDQIFAVYQLLSSMGLMTVEHLNLGIPTYDPAAYYKAVKDAPVTFVSPQGERLDRVLRSLNRN